jgi:hypothetical protein
MRLRAFLAVAAVACCVHAQAQPASSSLPGAHRLPDAPDAGPLPGVDRRECGPTKWSALCAAGRWALFTRIDLRVSAPAFTAHYDMERAGNGEIQATYREKNGQRTRGGEIVLFGIDGFAYRSREQFPDPGNMIDYALSAPIALSQLASLLLDLGVIGAPSEVTASRAIAASNKTQYIRTAAPRAVVLYGPPWEMTGTVRHAGPDQVGFNVRLRYHPVDRNGTAIAARTEVIMLEGTMSFASPRATLPDSMDLTGWKVMRAGHDAPLGTAPTLKEARQMIPPP